MVKYVTAKKKGLFEEKAYWVARNDLYNEIEEAGRNPKDYMRSMGWDTSEITPELEECINLEITFDVDDVNKLAEAYEKAVLEILKEKPTMDLSKALYEAKFSNEVEDTLSNIVAERLLEAIQVCKRKLGL